MEIGVGETLWGHQHTETMFKKAMLVEGRGASQEAFRHLTYPFCFGSKIPTLPAPHRGVHRMQQLTKVVCNGSVVPGIKAC